MRMNLMAGLAILLANQAWASSKASTCEQFSSIWAKSYSMSDRMVSSTSSWHFQVVETSACSSATAGIEVDCTAQSVIIRPAMNNCGDHGRSWQDNFILDKSLLRDAKTHRIVGRWNDNLIKVSFPADPRKPSDSTAYAFTRQTNTVGEPINFEAIITWDPEPNYQPFLFEIYRGTLRAQ